MDRSKKFNQKRKDGTQESRTVKKSRKDEKGNLTLRTHLGTLTVRTGSRTLTVRTGSAAPGTLNPETEELSVDTTESRKECGSSATSILCTICLDTLSLDDLQDHMGDNEEDWTEWHGMDLQPTFCGHVFHSLCLNRWLKRDLFCPVCRDPVNPDPFLLPARIPAHAHPAAPETGNPETTELSEDMTESPKEGCSSESSVLCTICLDTLSVDDLEDWTESHDMDLQPTFCGHVFHSLCLNRWLKLEPFCPVCRDPVNPDPFLLPNRIPVHALTAAPETGNPETTEPWVDMTESPTEGGSSASSILCTLCLDTLSVDDLQDDVEDYEKDWTECQDTHLQPTFCGHVFHSLCLDRWLKMNPSCPVCRDPVNPDPFLLPDMIPGK